jgi:hypothetical protein
MEWNVRWGTVLDTQIQILVSLEEAVQSSSHGHTSRQRAKFLARKYSELECSRLGVMTISKE